ncbi:MAG: hypothetical protein Kow0077_14920 [Anaerolineae bacterium]
MTDAELVILSLVTEAPQTGLQIQHAIETRQRLQWLTPGVLSVYHVLYRLEDEGLVSGREIDGERPSASRVYTLTETGRERLVAAITDRLSTPREPDNSFLVGLANLHLLRPEQVRRALDTYESRLRTRLAEINRLRQQEAAPDLQALALVDYRMHLLLAEIEWLAEFRQAWEAQAPAIPPAPPTFRPPVIRGGRTRPAGPHSQAETPSEESDDPPATE